jgi:hypothetical protein
MKNRIATITTIAAAALIILSGCSSEPEATPANFGTIAAEKFEFRERPNEVKEAGVVVCDALKAGKSKEEALTSARVFATPNSETGTEFVDFAHDNLCPSV